MTKNNRAARAEENFSAAHREPIMLNFLFAADGDSINENLQQ